MPLALRVARPVGRKIRVRGLVQGVGFRPTVWRLAHECGIKGDVCNDSEGVVIRAWGERRTLDRFIRRLWTETPPLARIDAVESVRLIEAPPGETFRIVASHAGAVHTGVVPDAATCPRCLADTLDPANRRFRYPFTNCTHCGPRLSILREIPYDRANTSMSAFTMCSGCQAEYDNPAQRRFHAQPNACPVCGPRARLEAADGRSFAYTRHPDVVDAGCDLLMQGAIVAIKGIGGFHLACDACNSQAVARLRERKRRFHKPFALMARDLEVIRRYCAVSPKDEALLTSVAAPIVIMPYNGPRRVAEAVAPAQNTLGFMLPYSPLHHVLLRRMDRPVVLTSGNLSEEPQCVGDLEAKEKLSRIADWLLTHERAIVNRVDDSVVRIMDGAPRVLRRARGYAPRPIRLPAGFEHAPELLAMGGELKNSFCLVKDGQAILSQHMGDLEDAATLADYRKNLRLYRDLFEHRPPMIVVDQHPEYLSTKLGLDRAEGDGLRLDEVQHHHAHVASCMADNGVHLDTRPVLGIALDGLGYGQDGALWGGEFLLTDYTGFERLATFKPVAMPGGTQAVREPWRNTYAHIDAALGWGQCERNYGKLELTRFLRTKPLAALDAMMANDVNSPPASSCGRLFDAVAAAIGICREHATYEGQAAIELQALIDDQALDKAGEGYPFQIERLFPPCGGRLGWGDNRERHPSPQPSPTRREGATSGANEPDGSQFLTLDCAPTWHAVLDDVARETPVAVMAARFHLGLARAIVELVCALQPGAVSVLKPVLHDIAHFDTVALTGGVFQNKTLLEQVAGRLRAQGFNVISHRQVPANDGGLSLGQATVAAARVLKANKAALGGTTHQRQNQAGAQL